MAVDLVILLTDTVRISDAGADGAAPTRRDAASSDASHQELPRMSTRETLRTTLMTLLEQEMGESYPMLTDDQDLRESLNLDSVDVVGLVMRIEREYRVRLATEELAGIKRVGDLLDLMETKLAAGPSPEGDGTPATSPAG
jgi:acyl carrier protein